MRTTTRRARPRKRKKLRRRLHRATPGVLVRQVIRQRPKARKGTVVLGLRCRVMSIVIPSETLVLAEAFQGQQIAIPVPSPARDGEQIRGMGLKPGQDVWLSLRA